MTLSIPSAPIAEAHAGVPPTSHPHATSGHGGAPASVVPGSAPFAPFASPDGSGSAAPPPLAFFFGLFAALVAAVGLAAQRLSRWLRLAPDLCRPPLYVSVLERPG